MQDLSHLAANSMWPTSQAAGNRQSAPGTAMTAPGSSPVDRELPRDQMADPEVQVGPPIPVGTSGKPAARAASAVPGGPPSWTRTTTPDVVREH